MLVEVLRPFQAGSGMLEAGAVVDATEWRLRDKLIEARYVRPARAQARRSRTSKEQDKEQDDESTH